jgi:hypothetical protein
MVRKPFTFSRLTVREYPETAYIMQAATGCLEWISSGGVGFQREGRLTQASMMPGEQISASRRG